MSALRIAHPRPVADIAGVRESLLCWEESRDRVEEAARSLQAALDRDDAAPDTETAAAVRSLSAALTRFEEAAASSERRAIRAVRLATRCFSRSAGVAVDGRLVLAIAGVDDSGLPATRLEIVDLKHVVF